MSRARGFGRRTGAYAALLVLLGSAAAGASPPERALPLTASAPTAAPVAVRARTADPGSRPPSASTLVPLPDRPPGGEPAEPPQPNPPAALTTQPLALAIDTTLIPGRKIEPIDLVTTLRLAGERDVDIAIARQRISQSLAELDRARSLWLPSLFLGPTYYRADGQVQTVTGEVINVNRSSLFLGGTATLPNGFPAPSAGTGYPQLNSLSSVLRISDMIFEPLAARRVVAANRAGLQARTNDALLQVAEAYMDLQQASGRLAVAREAAGNAELLVKITESYAKSGQGVEADHRRALAEFRHQRKLIQASSGQLLVASANLIRLLVLDAKVVVAPVEPAEAVLCLIPETVPLDDLVVMGLRNRPELAQSKELVQAAVVRLKQARLRPLIPSVSATYAGGGLGGGPDSFFGNFGARGDFMASIFWELQHLGFADVAVMRRNAAEKRTADLELIRVEAQVAADVVAGYEQSLAASRQIAESRETVNEAIESLKLNFVNMQQGAGLTRAPRPIEVLQPIQALAQARLDYLDSVITYNRAQFRLKRAIGQQPR